MKLETNVQRYAPRDGYIYDAKKERKAIEEEYDYRSISPGNYLCVSGTNAYAIRERGNDIGCGCADMTHNCNGKEICKHLIGFMLLKNLPDKEISEEMAQLLRDAGWSGTPLTPPDRSTNRRRQPTPDIPEPARKTTPPAPDVQDPANKTTPPAPTKAELRAKYEKMTPEEIIRGMDKNELEINARRGAPMAIAELERREKERAVSA